jgi:isopentenyldiphosphate isomerase
MIEPQQLIKLVRKLNYELGLRINQQKEALLEVCHGKVKLPDDFYVWNYAMVCNEYTESVGYTVGGTNVQEVPYQEFPSTVDVCAPETVNCRTCNSNPCNHTAACDLNHPIVDPIPTEYDPNNPYGDTCIAPRVFMNCKGEQYELIQVVNPSVTRTYRSLSPLRMVRSQEIDCDCPNLYYNTMDQGWLKGGFLFTTFHTGKVYVNYMGEMEDDQGQLLVPDHPLLNEYYEYALKKRIIENLALNGEDVAQRLQLIIPDYRAARNQAMSLVNTPNFKEMEELWWQNRRAQYSKYYDMFKSYQRGNYARTWNNNRVI